MQFESVFLHVADGVLIARPDGRIVRANPAACAALGRSEAELQTVNRSDLVVETQALQDMVASRERGDAVSGEITMKRADGRLFPAEFTSAKIPLDEGPMLYVIFRDISERKQAESQVASTAALYHAFFDGLHEGVCLMEPVRDAQGRIITWRGLDANLSMRRFTGLESMRGVTVHDLLAVGAEERVAMYSRVYATGVPAEYDAVFRDRVVTVRVFRQSDDVLGLTILDVTDERQARRELLDALTRFDAFMTASPALKWVKTPDDRFVYVNAAFQQEFGVTLAEAIGRRESELRPTDVATKLRADEDRILATGEPTASIEQHVNARDQRVTWWRTVRFRFADAHNAALLGGTAFDVTAQKLAEDALRESERLATQAQADLLNALETTRRTEEQLRQSQKMEAVGRLAGGIAHDFNNLLTVILGNGEMLAQRFEHDPMLVEVEEIRSAGQRAAMLTRQLLAFSRKQVLEPRVLNLNRILTDLESMLRRLVGEDIELSLRLHASPHLCSVDASQIEQVVLNLVVNARDAMPDGGQLTIETGNVTLDDRYVDTHPDARVGPHVMLSVSDSGSGMSPEVQSRLFEPFFTTKPLGKGTGLGLSTVYGIVRQSGGNIWVYSEAEQGTTFKIYLPRASSTMEDFVPAVISPQSVAGHERILLVEDDSQVRTTVAALLRGAGYAVIQASNGTDALQLFAELSEPIALLLTDIVMPKMNGRQLAEHIRRLHPELPVIFMSGYTEDVVVHHGVVDAGVDFLQKPLTGELLLPKVREVLDRPSQ